MRINLTNPVNWKSPLNIGLVSWWLGLPQYSGGNTWHDLCRRNNGTLTNGPAWTPDSNGYSRLGYDGTSDYVACDRKTPESAKMSFVVVIRPSTFTLDTISRRVLHQSDGLGNNEISLYVSSAGKIGWYVYTIAYAFNLVSSASIVVGEWTHIACTRSGLTAATYINGALDSTTADSGGVPAATLPLNIGRVGYLGNGRYAGQIAEVRTYSVALSAAEIAAIYADSRTGYRRTLNHIRFPRLAKAPAAGGGLLLQRRRAAA